MPDDVMAILQKIIQGILQEILEPQLTSRSEFLNEGTISFKRSIFVFFPLHCSTLQQLSKYLHLTF